MKTQTKNKIRLLAFMLIFAFIVAMIPVLTAPTKAATTHRIGAWTWNANEINEANLKILEGAGVNEIYLYAYGLLTSTSKHSQLHNYIQMCMNHGMRVSVMRDDKEMATEPTLSRSYITAMKTGYLAYKQTYPNDALYGVHFDCEPGTSADVLQDYCDNFLKNVKEILVDAGIYVEIDVNPAWGNARARTIDGTTQDLYDYLPKMLGGGKGCVGIMSYRNTADRIVSRANECNLVTNCKKYNCDFYCGIETDSVDSSFDASGKTKDQVCEIVYSVVDKLDSIYNPSCYYGMSIHYVATFVNLKGTLSTTKTYNGGGTPTGGSVTTGAQTSGGPQTTTTTKAPAYGDLTRHVIWSGDVNDSVSVGGYMGLYDNAAMITALQNEFRQNGTITGDEYYEIISTGGVSGSSPLDYASVGFYCPSSEIEIWGDDKATGCSAVLPANGTYTQIIKADATDKKGTLLPPLLTDDLLIAYFGESQETVNLSHFEIAVYRVDGGGGSNPPATTTTTKSSATSSTTKQQPSGGLTRNVIWAGDVNDSVSVGGYMGLYDNAAMITALQNEFKQNGTITGNEYYEIISTGSVSGSSPEDYASVGFYSPSSEVEIWGDDKATGCSAVLPDNGTYKQIIKADATDKKGTVLPPLLTDDLLVAYFGESQETVNLSHFEIAVYREGGSGEITTTTTTTTTTKTTTTTTQQVTPGTTTTQQVTPGTTTTTQQAPPVTKGEFVLYVENVAGSVGGNVQVPVMVSKNTGIWSIQVEIHYDPAVVTYKSTEITNTFSGLKLTDFTEAGTNKVVLQGMNDNLGQNVSTTGNIANLNFEIKSDAAAGTKTPLTVTYKANNIIDADGNNLAVTVTDGSITVMEAGDVYPGDAHKDGVIDMKDVLAVRKSIANLDPGANYDAGNADANQDDEIDMKDVLAIRKHVANIQPLGPAKKKI